MENYLPCIEKAFCEKCEKQLSTEVNLQEYLPNAVKVIKVTAIPYTDDCDIQKDAVCVKGHVKFSAVYLSDFKDKLKCAFFTSDFNHTFPAAGISDTLSENGFAECHIAVSEEKGTVLSPRKLSLSCKLHIAPEAYVTKKNIIFDTKDNSTVQKLSKNIDTMTVRKLQDCDFTVEETISLEEGMPKIKEIVSSECNIRFVDSEVTGGNVKHSGEICFGCIYLGEDETGDGQYITFTKTLPFTSAMPVQDIPDGSFVLSKGNITEIFADPAQDNYGENGLCSVRAGIMIQSKAYVPEETEIICDVFSTVHDCECEVRETAYDSFMCGISEETAVSESIRTGLGNITDIVSANITASVVSSELPGKSPVFGFRAFLKLCGTSESGMLESLGTSFNFKAAVTHELCELPEKCRFDADVHVKECVCRIENGEIKCDMVLCIKCAVYSRKNARTVTAMSIDDSCEICRDKSEYIIYYPDEKDTVWSCAKKYRVCPEQLLAVNGMNKSDTVFSGKKAVVIPR